MGNLYILLLWNSTAGGQNENRRWRDQAQEGMGSAVLVHSTSYSNLTSYPNMEEHGLVPEIELTEV